MAIRNEGGMSFKELDAEFDEDSQRIWKFICEEVIFRDSLILNKYQSFIKARSYSNIQRTKNEKLKKEQAAKELFKAQLKRNETLLMGGASSMTVDTEEVMYQKKLNEF